MIGLDIDQAKVDAINRGESYIKHIAAADVAEQVAAGRFRASSDFSLIAGTAAAEVGGQKSEVSLSAVALAKVEPAAPPPGDQLPACPPGRVLRRELRAAAPTSSVTNHQ